MADASSNTSNFQLQQVIPDKVRIPTLADAGSILARTKSTLFPATSQSQTIYNGSQGSPFIFRISNARDYLDLRSCVLDFQAQIFSPSAGANQQQYVNFDESALAWVNRIRILVAGVLVEDIMDANILSQIKKFYTYLGPDNNTIDDSLGGYKWSSNEPVTGMAGQVTQAAHVPQVGIPSNGVNTVYGGGDFAYTTAPNTQSSERCQKQAGSLAVRNHGVDQLRFGDGTFQVGGGVCTYTRRYGIPMRLISHFFNTKQWFYLRNASIQVELYCETPADCLVILKDTQRFDTNYEVAPGFLGISQPTSCDPAPNGGGLGPLPAQTYYALNDLTIRADTYTMDNEIVGMIDNIIASQGLVYGYETVSTIQASFNSPMPAIPFTRAVSDATQFTFVAQPQTWSNSLVAFGLTGWALPGLDNVQLQVGSTPFPITPMNAMMTRYVCHQAFNGDPADTLSFKQIPNTKTIANNQNTTNYTFAINGFSTQVNDSDLVCQPIAYPLRRTNTEGIYFINAGYNTGLDSGSMVLRFTWAPPNLAAWGNGAPQMAGYLFLQYVRLLSMAGGRVSVSS